MKKINHLNLKFKLKAGGHMKTSRKKPEFLVKMRLLNVQLWPAELGILKGPESEHWLLAG